MIRLGQAPHQIPLLVGSGRLARHLDFYFRQLKISFNTWNRHESDPLSIVASTSSRVYLAVSDSALQKLIDEDLADFSGPIIHFSGAFSHPRTVSAHPLMSFGTELYAANFYPQIHFAITGAASLEEAIPGMRNPWSVLPEERKALYHALCVLGGNFPILLWNKMENDLRQLGLPSEAVRLYVERIARNYIEQGEHALTGPVVRKDHNTIEKNLAALSQDPWRKVYEAFLETVR